MKRQRNKDTTKPLLKRGTAISLALGWCLSPTVFGLGLGTIETNSKLNEPFVATIPLINTTATDFDTLAVKLADVAQFERAGVPRDANLLQLKFEVVDGPRGRDLIRITSREPILEPYLSFLIEATWAKGHVIREYTVLLDPPLYDRNKVRHVTATSATAAATPSTSAAGAPGISGSTYGPVRGGDTLWRIASRITPDASASVNQMMIALLRLNPEAFLRGNINLVKRGAVLRIPSRGDIEALSRAEALAEVRRQHQLWQEYRGQATTVTTPQEVGPTVTTAPGEEDELEDMLADAEAEGDARLELVAPDEQTTPTVAPGAATAAGSGVLSNEELAATQRENEELRTKLDEADEIIDLLQRQIEIKDEELATLQARLAELSARVERMEQASAEVAPPAPLPTEPIVEAQPPSRTQPAPTTAPAPQPETGPKIPIIGDLIPAHVREMVPGGIWTILGLLGLLLFGLLALLARAFGRRERPMPTSERAMASRAASDTEVSTAADTIAEEEADTTVSRSGADSTADLAVEVNEFDDAESDPAIIAPLEATNEQLSAAVMEEDPLEEVNVYLAYERFDQAEELVKKVIAEHPDEHKYKLRLLEIYYSADNKPAYENAARELLDAVGPDDPLWENALAMWGEMSPSRALFTAGDDIDEDVTTERESAFVDVTGEDADTAAVDPDSGADEALEATRVSAQTPAAQHEALDFDLGDVGTDNAAMFDVTSDDELPVGEGVVDLTAEATPDLLDFTEAPSQDTDAPAVGGLDLEFGETDAGVHDETDSGVGAETDTDALVATDELDADEGTSLGAEDLMNVTEPGMGVSIDEVHGADAAEVIEDELDFDISDTVSPADDVAEESLSGTDEMGRGGDDQPVLDFDLSTDSDDGLAVEDTMDLSEGDAETDDFDLTDTDGGARGDGEIDFELDLTDSGDLSDSLAKALSDSADLDLALENIADDQELDLSVDGSGGVGSSDADIEFDLALQDTTDFEKLTIDDTLELPNAAADDDFEQSLEDLTRAMEESISGLDLELDDDDEDTSDVASSDETDTSLGLDLDISADDDPALSTMALDTTDGIPEDQSTVALPKDQDGASTVGDPDEVDTKLNLARAYIELGDNDGAKSILEEVSQDGNAEQRQEAQSLLDQIS